MMEIIKEGDPILREVAKPVDSTVYVRELIEQMTTTMKEADGIGLAAPQVGFSVRLFLIKNEAGEINHYINPEIMDQSIETVVMGEGCLSIDGFTALVSRPKYIKAKWLDLEMNEHIEDLDPYMSRVFQHEYDHLEGVLFIDYLV